MLKEVLLLVLDQQQGDVRNNILSFCITSSTSDAWTRSTVCTQWWPLESCISEHACISHELRKRRGNGRFRDRGEDTQAAPPLPLCLPPDWREQQQEFIRNSKRTVPGEGWLHADLILLNIDMESQSGVRLLLLWPPSVLHHMVWWSIASGHVQ